MKWLVVLSIISLIIFGICDIWLRYFGTLGDHRGLDLVHSIEILLGIPKNYNRSATKAGDIMHINDEEWNNPSCIPMDRRQCFGYGEPCINTPINDRIAPLKECISIHGNAGWREPYCNHWTRHNCVTLWTYEYILERPDILNKLIEILEKPCQYLPTEGSLIKNGAQHVSSAVESARRAMHCGSGQKKPYIFIISILDKTWTKRSEIVVRRKE